MAAAGDSDEELSPQVLETQRQMVQELAETVRKPDAGIADPSVLMFGQRSDEGYWRFLKQSNWNIVKALELMKAASEWHLKNVAKLEEMKKQEAAKKPNLFSLRQVGFDKRGRPVLFMSFAQNAATPAEHTVDAVIMHIQHIAESAGAASRQLTDEEGKQFVLVIDCAGLQPAALKKPTMMVKVNQTMTLLYPNTVRGVLLFNYNQEARNTWRDIKQYLDADTAAKIKFIAMQSVGVTLSQLFNADLATWLKEEMALNKKSPLADEQVRFWQANPGDHDPRGCPSFVEEFLVPDPPNGAQPHPGILYGPKA